jgi:hypothetical protein
MSFEKPGSILGNLKDFKDEINEKEIEELKRTNRILTQKVRRLDLNGSET